MENRAERTPLTRIGRFANRLAIIAVGVYLAFYGYQEERNFHDALVRAAEVHCREVIGSIPSIPDIRVTEETWQSCREVFLKGAERNPTDEAINYLAMGGGSLTVVFGLARLLGGLPFLPRGRGRFNLS